MVFKSFYIFENYQQQTTTMQKFTPNKEQSAIYKFALSSTQNILIDAKAGTGKTTTIVHLCNLLPKNLKVIFLAFNKSIVEELRDRLPSNTDVMTLHSLGFKILRDNRSRKIRLDGRKLSAALKPLAQNWQIFDDYPEDEAIEYLSRVKKLAGLYKVNLVSNLSELKSIAEKHSIITVNGELSKAQELVKVTNRDKSKIDFDDMIYQAVESKNLTLPKYDVVLLDECQDLNKAQQALAMSIIKEGGRFIAVGDPMQAIYGFAGADSDSFDRFINYPNTKTFTLSECYRCSKEIIKHAQEIVPEIVAFSKMPQGKPPTSVSLSEVKQGYFIMCRTNLPLITTFYQLIRRGFKAYVKGKDFGATLANLIKRSKADNLEDLFIYCEKVLDKTYKRILKQYPDMEHSEVIEHNSFISQNEKNRIIKTISDNNEDIKNPKALISKITAIFAEQKEAIVLSSIHKAKGLESNHCLMLRADLLDKFGNQEWELKQEKNLNYVARTRAKLSYNYITDVTDKNEYIGPEFMAVT